MDDTFFSYIETVSLARAFKRVVATKPELDKGGRLDLMRRIVDLAEVEGILDEEALFRLLSCRERNAGLASEQ